MSRHRHLDARRGPARRGRGGRLYALLAIAVLAALAGGLVAVAQGTHGAATPAAGIPTAATPVGIAAPGSPCVATQPGSRCRHAGARRVARWPPPMPSAAPGTLERWHYYSAALHHEATAYVYLPPGYAKAAAHGRRYGVMYLLHGAPGVAARIFTGGMAARDATLMITAHRIRPMILVAPFGLYAPLRNQTEWADGRAGAFESYVRDTVHATDAAFATRRDRAHRVVAGDSEGGFGAANVALHNLSMFGAFQSWSGYFLADRSGTFAGASTATLVHNSPMIYVRSLAAQIRRLGLHAYLYEGAQDHNGSMGMPEFFAELRAAGADVGSAVYRGGHNWTIWRVHMPQMLLLASQWMSSGHARAGGTPA